MTGGPFSLDGDPAESNHAPDWDVAEDLAAVHQLLGAMVPGDDGRDRTLDVLHEIDVERGRQVGKHGHDPDADAALPPHVLPAKAREFIQIATDRMRGEHRDLPRARRKLVQAAALIVAALETFPPTEQPS